MNNSDKLRVFFGLVVLLVLSGLALAIGLGTVEEKTSYGLMPIVLVLASALDRFTQWAFKSDDNRNSRS